MRWWPDKSHRAYRRQCREGKAPAWLCDWYWQYRAPDPRQRITDATFVVFDVEATGLNPAKDCILSLAAVRVQGGVIDLSGAIDFRVQQANAQGAEAVLIHQILPQESRQADISETAMLRYFLQFCGSSILVAHHAALDCGLLDQALQRHHQVSLLNHTLDTLVLARRLAGNPSPEQTSPQQFTLNSLCAQYGIALPRPHEAASDTLATAQLLCHQLHQAQRRGLRTLGELGIS
jgi:DNA polymerase-3 subunit epsilon